MSITPDEAAYDEYMAQLYEEHKKEAIEEFTYERLQSYYFDHKLLAEPAVRALSEARNLVGVNETAGFIFAAIAIEVGLKTTLLKPIVYGLVHTESAAALITDLTVSNSGMDRYRQLLLQILQDHGGVDLDNLKRSGASKMLWNELKDIQKIRNGIMHRGEMASKEDARSALDVASEILESIFPAVVIKLGFHLHNGFTICSDWRCKFKGTPFETIIKGT